VAKSSLTPDDIPNPTPSDMVLADFIEPMGLSQNSLARGDKRPAGPAVNLLSIVAEKGLSAIA
jgi:DNA-binding transcriptional regulator YiaG